MNWITGNKYVENYIIIWIDAFLLQCQVKIDVGPDFICFFATVICLFVLNYRKSLNTSRALNRGRASNTSRGSDLIVPIEAGPRIEAGP